MYFQNGHPEVVEYLARQLSVGSIDNVDGGDGKTAVAVAAEGGHLQGRVNLIGPWVSFFIQGTLSQPLARLYSHSLTDRQDAG